MKKGIIYSILVVLILLAFGRGIWALGEKSLWWDESLSLHRAKGSLMYVLSNEISLTDGMTDTPTTDNHPPLYFLLLWLSVRLFGESEFALRIGSLAAVVIIVPLLYVTGKRLLDTWAGLAAALLGAVSPMYLWYGQEARPYALVALLGLLSLYLLLRAFLEPSGPVSVRHRRRWMVAYVVTSACLVLTHYLGATLIAFELVALGLASVKQSESGGRRTLLLTIAIVVVISLPALTYAWITGPRGATVPGLSFVPLWVLLRDLHNSFSLGLTVDLGDWPVVLINLVFLFFLLWGMVWLFRPGSPRDRRSVGWLLIGCLLFPTILVYLLGYVFPVYRNSRHLIVVSPAFYLLVAIGLTRLRGRLQVFVAIGLLAMLGGVGYSTYNHFCNPLYSKDHHREWGALLREMVRPGDVVVVNPPAIVDLYKYYADSGVLWVGLPPLGGSDQDTAIKLEQLLQEYDRVWLAVSGDLGSFPETWLNENAFRVLYAAFAGSGANVVVACYLPGWPSVPQLPDDAQPLDIHFTPELRLEGYRLVSPPQSGELLQVELFWAVDDSIPEEASVLLRLVDEKGHVWGQRERCPFNALYPMWQWSPGLLLRDEYEVPVSAGTPPGEYELELALVSRPTPEGCLGSPGEAVWPLLAPDQVRRGERVLLGMVDVQPPETAPSLGELEIEHRHTVRFGGLVLLGTDVAPRELRAGESLHVVLYWEAKKSSLPDARFRLRFVDASGEVWQELRVRPAGDNYPTDNWHGGDRVFGQFHLPLPEDLPDGRYWLELLPEPPVQRTGAFATLRRWLGWENQRVKLDNVEVEAVPVNQPFSPIPTPVDWVATHPVAATLGDCVRFLGYDLESESVKPGETVSLTLHWQALCPLELSYSVFTHLLGPSDEILGQKDGVPQDGTYPTMLWRPGEVIADPYSIAVGLDVPPGSYRLEVGMYRWETGVRLPVTDAYGRPVPDDRILLSEVTVLPSPELTPSPVARHPDLDYDQVLYLPLIAR